MVVVIRETRGVLRAGGRDRRTPPRQVSGYGQGSHKHALPLVQGTPGQWPSFRKGVRSLLLQGPVICAAAPGEKYSRSWTDARRSCARFHAPTRTARNARCETSVPIVGNQASKGVGLSSRIWRHCSGLRRKAKTEWMRGIPLHPWRRPSRRSCCHEVPRPLSIRGGNGIIHSPGRLLRRGGGGGKVAKVRLELPRTKTP